MASRQGYNLLNKFGRKAFFEHWEWKLMILDTFGFIPCLFVGHKEVIHHDENDEKSCSRCCRWIK